MTSRVHMHGWQWAGLALAQTCIYTFRFASHELFLPMSDEHPALEDVVNNQRFPAVSRTSGLCDP